MKRLSLLLSAIAVVATLAACTPTDNTFGSYGPVAGKYTPIVPAYYDTSACHTEFVGPAGDYCRLPAQRGAFHYLLHNPSVPLRQPLKARTWRYTNRMPTQWGSPIFVTTCKTAPVRQQGPAVATTQLSAPAAATATR